MFRDIDRDYTKRMYYYDENLRSYTRYDENRPSLSQRLEGNILPESQMRVLLGILLNGSETIYGLHKALEMPLSTVGSAINQLAAVGAVIWTDKKEDNRRNKKYYALTLCGFFQAIFLLIDEVRPNNKADTDNVKAGVARGFKQWPSLCPEFFEHWKELTDDSKHPGSSDYWFEFLYRISRVKFYVTSKEQFFTVIALLLWDDWIDGDISSEGYYAAAALKEIPDIWGQISPTLYKMRDNHRKIMDEIDTLLL